MSPRSSGSEPVNEELTQSEARSLLADFTDLRDSVRDTRIGRGGREVCAALTGSLDRAVAALLPSLEGTAVVALGGYGRGELSPYSDVDLMLLHEVDDVSDLAADLFRPLWDARLQVGHSVRTVREAATAARERFDSHTTLLTARLVAGSEGLFSQLMDEVARVTKARPLRNYLVEAERERRNEAPFPIMAVDLKTGRGGLRALQAFEWVRRRQELIGRFTADSQPVEEKAKETILRVRNALHAVSGRRSDVFVPELRVPVAGWLEEDVFEVASELMAALASIDRLAESVWPEVIDQRPRRLGRKVWSGGRRGGLTTDDPPDLATLDLILRSGERGRAVFDTLWETGQLNRLFPEWGVVVNLPQLEPFHEHPVGAHVWRTVAEMEKIISGDGDNGEYGKVALHLNRPDLLRLAAFLHDIGKGHGGDHAEIGADIVASFARRLGIESDEARLLIEAVRHHLLLPITATRRDLDDPAVIEEVATLVGSIRLLEVLYLLTVADSRATGSSMWSDWKANLLRTLFRRCRRYLETAVPVAMGTTPEEVLALAGDRVSLAELHLNAMPSEYLRSVAAVDVLLHIDLIMALRGVSNLATRDDQPIATVVVVGKVRPGFRRIVADVFAAHGIDVLEARVFGRSDGLVVDTFWVRDGRTSGAVPAERWDLVRSDIEDGLSGALDTASKVASRASAYPVGGFTGEGPTARVSVDPASGDTVVVVKCSDRIGRLAEILSVLDDCGLDIRLAKLDSREGEIVDTFHVGQRADLDRAALGDRIAASLTP